MQGDFDAFEEILSQCRQLYDQHELGAPYKIIVDAFMLERTLERCDFENASALAKQILDALIDAIGSPKLWLRLELIYSKLVEYFLAIQDRDNLEKNFNQMLKYAPHIRGEIPDMPWNLIDAQVRGWLAVETDPGKSRNLDELKTFLSNKRAMRLEEQIAYNRILLAQGHLNEAQSGLEQLVNSLASTQIRDCWLQALILLALVYWNKREEDSASQALHSALVYGQSAGYQMIFIREGNVMKDLLRHSLTQISEEKNQQILRTYVQSLLTGFEQRGRGEAIAHDSARTAVPVTLGHNEELLSRREIEVLQLLADGKAYKEIAMILKISLNTVKAHVKHIYSKLDVNSRNKMYARARERNLID